MREASLYGPIRTSGPFARKAFWYEVGTAHWSLGRRRIDMVTTAGTSLVAIEVKVRDWPAVLRQARFNQYVAEYSYAAIWHKTIPRVDLGHFDDLGIGVLEVANRCRTVVAAKRSGLVDSERNAYVRAQCAGVAGGGPPGAARLLVRASLPRGATRPEGVERRDCGRAAASAAL